MKTILISLLAALAAYGSPVGPVDKLRVEPHKQVEALDIYVTHVDKREAINILIMMANQISPQHNRSHISLETFEAPDGQTVYKVSTNIRIPKDIADKYRKNYEKMQEEEKAKTKSKKAI